MIPIQQYWKENNLFDLDTLKSKCEHSSVKMKAHPSYDYLFVLNYSDAVQCRKIPWDNFNKRCRGLVVDVKNKIISHSFDKFFNLGEDAGFSYDELKDRPGVSVVEKLDGTMLNIFWHEPLQTWIASTRSEFVNKYTEYGLSLFLQTKMIEPEWKQFTIIFEIVDPQFRNVIDYSKKLDYVYGIYCLGLRGRTTDQLHKFDVPDFLYIEGRPLFDYFPWPESYPFSNLDDIITNTKNMSWLEEGYVLWYPNGDLIKVKSPEYLKVHRIIWNYSDDRILELIEQEDKKTLDEMLISAPEEYSKSIAEVVFAANIKFREYQDKIYSLFSNAPKQTRKDFALWVNSTLVDELSPLRPFLFGVLDNKPISKSKIIRCFRDGTLSWRNNGEEGENGKSGDAIGFRCSCDGVDACS